MPFIRRDHFPDEPDILNDYVPSRPRNIDDAPLSAMPGHLTDAEHDHLSGDQWDAASLEKRVLSPKPPFRLTRAQDHRKNLPPPRTKATPENLQLAKAMIADSLAVAAVAEQLGVQKRTVENWIAKGLI